MDCNVSDSMVWFIKKKNPNSWHTLSELFPLEYILVIVLIWLLWQLSQYPLRAFTYDGRDICLSDPLRNAQPKEMLTMFSFFIQEESFFICRRILCYCKAKADIPATAAAVFILSSATHHLVQLWQKYRQHLYCLVQLQGFLMTEHWTQWEWIPSPLKSH